MPSTRTNDPVTSHEAAESVTNSREIYKAVIELLTEAPCTDTDLRARYLAVKDARGWGKIGESTIRARRSELVDLGLVEESGVFEILESGRRSIIWQVADV